MNAFHYSLLFAQRSFCCDAQSILQILTSTPGKGWLNWTRLFKSFVTKAPGKSIRRTNHKPLAQANVPKTSWQTVREKFHAKSNREGKCVDNREKMRREGNIGLRDYGKNNFVLLGAVWNLWLRDFNKNILMFILSADKRVFLEKATNFYGY
jgi:hypothetical protein